jgi:hypothetical protein
MMDPATWKKQCVNTKGFGPEHVPLLVRAVTRLISDSKIPVPAAIYVASNWAGIFKVIGVVFSLFLISLSRDYCHCVCMFSFLFC